MSGCNFGKSLFPHISPAVFRKYIRKSIDSYRAAHCAPHTVLVILCVSSHSLLKTASWVRCHYSTPQRSVWSGLGPRSVCSKVAGLPTVPHHRESARVSFKKKKVKFFKTGEEHKPLNMTFQVRDGTPQKNPQRGQVSADSEKAGGDFHCAGWAEVAVLTAGAPLQGHLSVSRLPQRWLSFPCRFEPLAVLNILGQAGCKSCWQLPVTHWFGWYWT